MQFRKYTLPAAAILLGALPAQAAEWTAEPAITLISGYNDNIRLTASAHDSVQETALTPSVKFGVAQENHGLSGEADFSIRRFTGGSGQESGDRLDREDFNLSTFAWYNSLRDSISANLGYTRDSSLDSELDQTGNVTDDRATRERYVISPTWSRMLSELNRITLGFQLSTVDYTDDPGIANLVGYEYHTASASLDRQLTARLQGTLSASFSSYLPDTDFNSDTISLQAGLTADLSQTLKTSILVGQRTTTSDSFIGTGFCLGANPGATFPSCLGGIPIGTGGANAEVETTAAVFTASISQQLETGLLSASLTRSSSPSSDGELLDITRLVLIGEHRFTETLRARIKAEYSENETIVNRIGIVTNQGKDKDKLIRITPKIIWNWKRDWNITGEYRYAKSEDAATAGATLNAVYFSLAYAPPKRTLSR